MVGLIFCTRCKDTGCVCGGKRLSCLGCCSCIRIVTVYIQDMAALRKSDIDILRVNERNSTAVVRATRKLKEWFKHDNGVVTTKK